MFSGIVEAVGTVTAIEPGVKAIRLTIEEPSIAARLGIGDSIATSGVCLTVVERDEMRFSVEAIPETMRLTTLGDLEVGSGVNLECALTLHDGLGGHLVSGHVDGVGERLAGPPDGYPARETGEDEVIHWYSIPPGIRRFFVPKGSVTVAGVSLTVVDVAEAAISVALIPHTLEVTTLGALTVGDRINLEADMIAKYVTELIEPYIEALQNAGAGAAGA